MARIGTEFRNPKVAKHPVLGAGMRSERWMPPPSEFLRDFVNVSSTPRARHRAQICSGAPPVDQQRRKTVRPSWQCVTRPATGSDEAQSIAPESARVAGTTRLTLFAC